uniref:Uncharacterized protein n=1 Tax=Timema poppense TaxID=170557 RepID=A0A7R9DNH7_TIMPO|nr:unnamed protein product [Timema poppensis]
MASLVLTDSFEKLPDQIMSMSRHTGGWHSADVSDEGDSLMDEPASYSYDDLMYYCDTRSIYSPQVPATQQHFGLSKYGHLKIDYSSSWHSLDRYIMSD